MTDLALRKQFPILGAGGVKIDWQLVFDHGAQARANHYQTVVRLAERGGLSWSELHAVLHNRAWREIDENTAIIECRALEARYIVSIDAIQSLTVERDAALARVADMRRGLRKLLAIGPDHESCCSIGPIYNCTCDLHPAQTVGDAT